MQSGTALAIWAYQSRDVYASRAFELGGYVGCSKDTSASLISCLRDTNVSDILAAYPQFYVWQTVPLIIWSPTDEPDVEGALLADSPANIYAASGIRDLPWIGGVDRDEGVVVTEGEKEETTCSLVYQVAEMFLHKRTCCYSLFVQGFIPTKNCLLSFWTS